MTFSPRETARAGTTFELCMSVVAYDRDGPGELLRPKTERLGRGRGETRSLSGWRGLVLRWKFTPGIRIPGSPAQDLDLGKARGRLHVFWKVQCGKRPGTFAYSWDYRRSFGFAGSHFLLLSPPRRTGDGSRSSIMVSTEHVGNKRRPRHVAGRGGIALGGCYELRNCFWKWVSCCCYAVEVIVCRSNTESSRPLRINHKVPACLRLCILIKCRERGIINEQNTALIIT